MAAGIRFINPDTLAKPPSYTHVVEVTAPGRLIYISGQLGTDREGHVVGDVGDFRAQAVQVFDNLKAALAAVGASFKDVVKVNSYLADIDYMPILREVRAPYLNSDALPASTTLAVSGFARPSALLEVELVAVLPAKAASSARKTAGAKSKKPARRAARSAKTKTSRRKR
jgi:enamine deaminase RidA (YjgF/YER057c/UK114 family)